MGGRRCRRRCGRLSAGRHCETASGRGRRSRSRYAMARARNRDVLSYPRCSTSSTASIRLEDVTIDTRCHRHPPREHGRRSSAAMLGDAARRAPVRDRQPRRPRPRVAGVGRSHPRSGRAGVARRRRGAPPTCASRPGSSSRTSSRASPAVRRWWRPGLAGLETTLTLHDAARIGHPDARWGITQGNPVHDDVRAIARGDRRHVRARRDHRSSPCRASPRSAATCSRCIDVACDARALDLHARGPREVRPRCHIERGLSARPEPLPGRQGNVQRLRRWCGQAARSCASPSVATGSPTMARTAAS